MAITFNGSTQYAKNSSAPIVSGTPFSVAGWFYASGGSSGTLCQIQDDGSGNQYYRLFVGASAGNQDVQAYTRNAGSNEFSGSANTYDTSAWNHCAGAWGSATSRKSWCNGGTATADTNSVTDPSGINSIDFGRAGDTSSDNYLTGELAMWAVWDGYELTDADVAKLHDGRLSPYTIRPDKITRVWEMSGPATVERKANQLLTLFNSPTLSESLMIKHPSFRARQLAPVAAVASGGLYGALSLLGVG